MSCTKRLTLQSIAAAAAALMLSAAGAARAAHSHRL